MYKYYPYSYCLKQNLQMQIHLWGEKYQILSSFRDPANVLDIVVVAVSLISIFMKAAGTEG